MSARGCDVQRLLFLGVSGSYDSESGAHALFGEGGSTGQWDWKLVGAVGLPPKTSRLQINDRYRERKIRVGLRICSVTLTKERSFGVKQLFGMKHVS